MSNSPNPEWNVDYFQGDVEILWDDLNHLWILKGLVSLDSCPYRIPPKARFLVDASGFLRLTERRQYNPATNRYQIVSYTFS